MLSSAKSFFPELFESLKGWPLWFRAVLFILAVAVPLIFSIFSFNEVQKLLNTPFSVTPLVIAIAIVVVVSCLWLFSTISRKSKHRRQIYQFCESWLDYLPFMLRLISKIEVHKMREEKLDVFDFLDGKGGIDGSMEDIYAFHEWKAKLRELLFKVGEAELSVTGNQHWEKLKKESKIFEAQSYLTPFSFILDQTQPWLLADKYKKEAWAALYISEEFIEMVAFKYPKVERLWKKRQKWLEQVAKDFEQKAENIERNS